MNRLKESDKRQLLEEALEDLKTSTDQKTLIKKEDLIRPTLLVNPTKQNTKTPIKVMKTPKKQIESEPVPQIS